jgi:hypothetical protein
MSNSNDIVLSNIISLNPTGTLDFQGTFALNGSNSIVQNPADASKNNLDKTTNNEIICGTIENFTNQNNLYKINDIEYKELRINYLKKYIFLIVVFIFLILILYLI